MMNENPIENEINLPPINLNTSLNKSAKSKSFSNFNIYQNEDSFQNNFSPSNYAEAFNQISNAKFRVLSRIEKLKNDKANQIIRNQILQENNLNNDYPYNEKEIYENFNQVYSYMNSPNEYEDIRKNGNNVSNINYNNNRNNNLINNRNHPNHFGNYNSYQPNPYYLNQAHMNFRNYIEPQFFPNNHFTSNYMNPGADYIGLNNIPFNYGYAMPYPNYLSNLANLNNPNNYDDGSNRDKVIFPKISMGMPVNPNNSKNKNKRSEKKKNKSLSNYEILSALKELINKRNENSEENEEESEKEISEEDQSSDEDIKIKTLKKKKNNLDSNKDRKVKKEKNENKKNDTAKWWNLLRDFSHISIFYISSRKQVKASFIRYKEILNLDTIFPKYIEVLKKWLIQIQLPLWNEIKKADLNLSFNTGTPKAKFTENSQKIMAFLNTFIKNILAKSTKNVDIPDVILQIMFKLINKNSSYPRNYLNSFELNRMNFGLNGDIKNISNDNIMGMLIAFLIISKSAIQTIFLKPLANIEQVKNFKNIEISMKFLGSILHYIVQETFLVSLPILKDKISLFNYFRNYKIIDPSIENQKTNLISISSSNININNVFELNDKDNLNGALIDDAVFKEFMQVNKNWVEAMKKYILQWSIGLARYIKLKFEK